jgi:hypothetical protein
MNSIDEPFDDAKRNQSSDIDTSEQRPISQHPFTKRLPLPQGAIQLEKGCERGFHSRSSCYVNVVLRSGTGRDISNAFILQSCRGDDVLGVRCQGIDIIELKYIHQSETSIRPGHQIGLIVHDTSNVPYIVLSR